MAESLTRYRIAIDLLAAELWAHATVGELEIARDWARDLTERTGKEFKVYKMTLEALDGAATT